MDFFLNASEVLESLNVTLIYTSLVGLGIVCCGLAYFFGGDDGGGLGDGGDTPGLVISPTGLAFCTTCVGAFGLILYHGFSMSAFGSMLLSVVLSIIMMFAFNYVFFKVFLKSGAVLQAENLEGVKGEVYTAIPAEGMGEVIYRDSRGRQKSAARSADGTAIPSGTPIVIKSALGAALVVEKQEKSN